MEITKLFNAREYIPPAVGMYVGVNVVGLGLVGEALGSTAIAVGDGVMILGMVVLGAAVGAHAKGYDAQQSSPESNTN